MTAFIGGFTGSDISGLVARAILLDQRVNYLAFDNFPEVILKMNESGFEIRLRVHDVTSELFFMDRKTVKKEVRRFKKREEMSPQLFDIFQELLAQFEGAVMASESERGIQTSMMSRVGRLIPQT